MVVNTAPASIRRAGIRATVANRIPRGKASVACLRRREP